MPETGQGYWQRVEEIFHQALELTPDARPQFLREQCGGDAALETDVREILTGYQEQDRLNAAGAGQPRGRSRYGAFEIVRKIGEGGMGAVYLARRHEDFEQRAAIKLINGSPAAVALMAERFRQERQILAGLEHPNIARLLDGGVTDDGQPYLVMEYVEGVRLDEYCASHTLPVRPRIELFRKICAAVHFAHQHLVIHRDLKPGNILIDQQGEPKLLDFGIAKVVSAPGNSLDDAMNATKMDATTMTMTGGLMMTPQFASPEQFQGLPCTVASDVYSLGVILYELLAGQGPYAANCATPAQLIAAVITQEAPRPSAIAPVPLKPALRGDLDGIVMKALAKKPGERYGSVEQLSEDLRRHLEGLPVSAVEGTRLYIARKFVGRHRVAVGAAALVLFSLLAGLAGTIWQARLAERERILAEQRFSDARKLANYLLFPLYDSVQALPGSLPVRAGMASQSLLYLDRLAAAKSNDGALHLDLAEGYLRLGTILESPVGFGDSLGNHVKALESNEKALALLLPLSREHPDDLRMQQDLASVYLNLGPSLNLSGKSNEAVARMTEATKILDRLAAASPRDVVRQVAAGRAYGALIDVLSGRGGGIVEPATRKQVEANADRALAHFNAALALSPAEPTALVGVAAAYNTRANLVLSSGDIQSGLAILRQGLDALQRLPKAVREEPNTQGLEARIETMVGYCYGQLHQFPESLAVLKSAQVVLDRLGAADPRNATIAMRRVNLFRTRSEIDRLAGHVPDAIADYRDEIAILDSMVAEDPSKLSNRILRAEAQQKMAKLLAANGQMAEARRVAEAGIGYLDEVADRPDALPQYLSEAALAHMDPPFPALVDNARALRYALRADKLAQGKDPVAVFYLTQAYENLGDGAKAMETIQRLRALTPAPQPGEKPSQRWMFYEKHLRQIQYLIKNGHLPAP